MTKAYSNYDIMEKLGRIEEITLATKAQAEKTNGRVTKLEYWQSGVVAVEVDRNRFNGKDADRDYTKIALQALALVGTALSIIYVAVSK